MGYFENLESELTDLAQKNADINAMVLNNKIDTM